MPNCFVTLVSSAALDHGRALHTHLAAHTVLRDLGQQFSGGLWIEISRASACPVEETLAPALQLLDQLRRTIETRHRNKRVPCIQTLRLHLDALEVFIDTVPLAPTGASPAASAKHDLPTSGLLHRFLQQGPRIATPRANSSPKPSKCVVKKGLGCATKHTSRRPKAARMGVSRHQPLSKAA